MAYIGSTINNSPTIAGTLADAIKGEAAFLAVKFDDAGNIALAGKGEAAVGVIVPGNVEDPAAGDEVTIQIKDIGVAKAGGKISAGAAVAVSADGKLGAAATGDFIVGFALSGADGDGKTFQIQITKSGYAK
jgi:hypothetical protein|nr:MAG TPA_asm: capsid fiber protein [Caudoviricetes sp.]